MSRITIAELFPKYITAVKWYSFEEKENVRLQKEYGIFLPKGKLIVLTTGEYADRYNIGIYDNFFSLRRKILSLHKKIKIFEFWQSFGDRVYTIDFPIEQIARSKFIWQSLLKVVFDDNRYAYYEFEFKTLNK